MIDANEIIQAIEGCNTGGPESGFYHITLFGDGSGTLIDSHGNDRATWNTLSEAVAVIKSQHPKPKC